MKLIVSVAISDATRGYDKIYDYFYNGNIEIKPGVRVIAPFGPKNKELEAYVFEVKTIEEETPKLKEIVRVVDLEPVLSTKFLELIKWMKQRYICTYNDAIRCILPTGMSATNATVKDKTIKTVFLSKESEEIIELIESSRVNRIQHVRVLEILLENDYVAYNDLLNFAGVSTAVLKTLKGKGYIDFGEKEVFRDPLVDMKIEKTYPLIPTFEQKAILEWTNEIIKISKFEEVLIHGVTGSGKTEVYLQAIQYCIEQGKQGIVLVPEISLTPQMVKRFKGRFGDEIAILHSRLSLGERYDQWKLIKNGNIKVAIGARSAIFAPLNNIGVIIIDEEHELSYKSETTPKYNTKEVARKICIANNALLILGSATPSVDTYFKAKAGEIKLFEMNIRANKMVLPHVTLVDMRCELEDGNRTVFSKLLKESVEKNIALKQQTMLFLNRRGYSTFVLCRNCGFVAKCKHCNVSMTYHSHDDRLICHYCGYTYKNYQKCPTCNSPHIKSFGTGTQKIQEEVTKTFENSSVIRMDADTTTTKNSHQKILDKFVDENINIMVGTQMIAKGHDFPNVTLVGVLAADSLLNTGDFRASERTFQLITQVAGRAGRGELEGKVVVQTYNVDDFSIQTAINHDYKTFYSNEIQFREKLIYPPFTNIGFLMLGGINDNAVNQASKDIYNFLENLSKEKFKGELIVAMPMRAPISKIKNKFRFRLILKLDNLEGLTEVLTALSNKFYYTLSKNKIDLSMDINPVSMI